MQHVTNSVVKLLKNFKNLVFPSFCLACREEETDEKQFFCVRCLLDFPYTDHLENPNNKVVEAFYGRIPIAFGGALLYFGKGGIVQEMMHRLKYERTPEIGMRLGEIAGEKLKKVIPIYQFEIVLPVPIHKKRLNTRGYNQSAVFGKTLAAAAGLPFDEHAFIKHEHTESQTKKTRAERIKNVENSFSVVHPESIKGRHILLVDDVITSGATLEACGKILLANGAAKVSVFSIAVGK